MSWDQCNRPKAKELRKLIGKHVAFKQYGWRPEQVGVVEEVSGLNIRIDNEWYWYGATGFSFVSLRAAPEHDE